MADITDWVALAHHLCSQGWPCGPAPANETKGKVPREGSGEVFALLGKGQLHGEGHRCSSSAGSLPPATAAREIDRLQGEKLTNRLKMLRERGRESLGL